MRTTLISSGRVRRTHCDISAGAHAPIAPVLTRPLLYSLLFQITMNSSEIPTYFGWHHMYMYDILGKTMKNKVNFVTLMLRLLFT